MAATKEIFYAAVGASDLAIEKVRKAQETIDLPKLNEINLTEFRTRFQRVGTYYVQTYGDLVARGQKTVKSITNSAYTKRAIDQTKTARSQTKAAVTSAKKAAATTLEASKNAAAVL